MELNIIKVGLVNIAFYANQAFVQNIGTMTISIMLFIFTCFINEHIKKRQHGKCS